MGWSSVIPSGGLGLLPRPQNFGKLFFRNFADLWGQGIKKLLAKMQKDLVWLAACRWRRWRGLDDGFRGVDFGGGNGGNDFCGQKVAYKLHRAFAQL